MKLTCVIPVHGRLPLLECTVKRLLERQTRPPDEVLTIGYEQEREVCERAGATHLIFDNFPLGRKWQFGIDQARERDATDILIMGSSDWISDTWIDNLLKYRTEVGMVGKRDIYFVHAGKKKMKACHWTGYERGLRDLEPIGTGRILFNQFLESADWDVLDDRYDCSIDWLLFAKVRAYGFKTLCAPDDVKAVSISTDAWSNKHIWADEADHEGSKRVPISDLLPSFPDMEVLRNELYRTV